MSLGNKNKCFHDLRRALNNLKHVVSDVVETRDLGSFKELEADIANKLENMARSVEITGYEFADDIDVDFVSNMAIPMGRVLESIDSLLHHRLDSSTICFDKRYYLGMSKNVRRYIVSSHHIEPEDLDALVNKGPYFIYDGLKDDLFIFDKALLHSVFKHLLFNGNEVELFYIQKKLENLLK